MARKLTDEERANLEILRDAMSQGVEPSLKNSVAAVASSLVRIQADVVTRADVNRILRRRGEQRAALEEAMMARALDPVPGQEGVWTLRVPEYVPEAEGQPAAGALPAPTAPAALPAGSGDAAEKVGAAEPAAAEREDSASAEPAPVAAASVSAPAEAEPAPEVSEPAPEVSKPAPESAPNADESEATASEPPVPAEAAASPDAGTKSDAGTKPGRGRKLHMRGRRRGRRGDAGKSDGQASDQTPAPAGPSRLSDVPYVRRATPDEDELRTKILQLDQRFWINGWLLSHPGAYALYQRELEGMNNALTEDGLPGDITRRQLAYRMGGDEKFFEYGSDGHKLLRALGMEDIIRHRPMPKADLLYFAPRRRKHMRVLVTENLDPWLDVHDLMYEEGRSTVLGERIHAVVLGGGTPVLERNRLALLLDTLGAESVQVLYWGDIDRAGVGLLTGLRDVLGEKYPMAPFTPAYQLMIRRARERYPEPLDNEQTGQANLDLPDMGMLCEGLSEEDAAYARAVVEGCRLVPQEILTRRDL